MITAIAKTAAMSLVVLKNAMYSHIICDFISLGTSACGNGKFYCKNDYASPKTFPSSRVGVITMTIACYKYFIFRFTSN